MSNPYLKDLDTSNEIDLTVRGRNSGQDISRPVWFVHGLGKNQAGSSLSITCSPPPGFSGSFGSGSGCT